MDITTELLSLQKRLREIREAQGLTLNQVAARSHGTISAIALGSYERGDRTISANKILEIAQIYQVPVSELFDSPQKLIANRKVVIDYRRLIGQSDPSAERIKTIVTTIAGVRRDWNGEVISLRESDIAALQIFASLTALELNEILNRYTLSTAK
jgi:transcriptional regulator with XRE-family HTH domain